MALAIAGGFYLWWEIIHRGTWTYTTSIYPVDPADEWRYTACGRLVAHGYGLFDQVYSAQPPLLFLSLAGGMHIFGDSIEGARWVEIGYGLLALASITWLSTMLGGRWAGVLAAVVMAVSPDFLIYAHTVEAEGPMMALTALALALAVFANRRQSMSWAFISGLVLGAAILMKLFAAEAVLPILWLYLWQKDLRTPRSYFPVAMLLIGVLLPVAIDFALLSPAQQWQQVVALHDQAATAPLPGLLSPGNILGSFLSLDLGLTVLAGAGLLALAFGRQWKQLGFVGFWLLGSLLMLFLFRPLFPHHAAILSGPLAAGAGIGLGSRLSVLPAAIHSRHFKIWVPYALVALAYVASVPRLAHADRHVLASPFDPQANPLVAWVDAHSRPTELIAADDVSIADAANRLVVPPLCDPSTVRLKSGDLTAGELIGATKTYRPVLVLPSLGIYQQVGPYLAWVRTHYHAVPAPGGVTAYVKTP